MAKFLVTVVDNRTNTYLIEADDEDDARYQVENMDPAELARLKHDGPRATTSHWEVADVARCEEPADGQPPSAD